MTFFSRKLFLTPVFIILILLAVSAFIYLNKPKTPSNDLDSPVAKVGAETLYYKDVVETAKNDKFSYFPSSQVSKYQNDKQTLLNLYLYKVAEESSLLQEGEEKQFINLSPAVFNSKTKNYRERRKLAQQVSKEASEKLLEKFNVQVVTLYYDHKDQSFLARQLMASYLFQINSGALTLSQAGEKIKADKDALSLSAKNRNAYRELFNLERGYKIVSDNQVNSLIYKSPIGEISPVTALIPRLRNYQTGRFEEVGVGYAIFSVTKHTQGEEKNYSSWLQSLRNKYQWQTL